MRKHSRLMAGVAAAALAFGLTACGGDTTEKSTSADAGASGGQVTLTIATFNEFGYDDLFAEYMTQNPNVKIEHKKAATTDEARQNLVTGLAAGDGLSDIEAAEVGWFAELQQYEDKFVDLKSPDVEGRWLDWKTEAATTKSGKLLGYGTDIGPEAICYRADLFKKAGLPTDRDEVAELLKGDWSTYFKVGKQFTDATKIPWFDGASGTYSGMVQQLANPYEESDGTPKKLADNTDVKKIYDELVANASLSAGLAQWSEDWVAAFQKDGFATMLCPPWMTGVIEGNAAGVTGWDIAPVFPGGGGNWGGSYLVVPAQSQHPEEARALADWLTSPEQQIKAFEAKGTFPSQVKALDSEQLLSSQAAFFNDAPSGQIFADAAKAITVQPFYGPNYFKINTIVADAITRFDVEDGDPAASWEQAVAEFDGLGI